MHILVFKKGSPADILCALPALKQLKRQLPGTRLTFMVPDSAAALASAAVFIDDVTTGLPEDLSPFDAFVDLSSNRTVLSAAASIPVRVGHGSRWLPGRYTTVVKPWRSAMMVTQAERDWRIFTALKPSLKYSLLVDTLEAADFRSESPGSPALVAAPITSGALISWGIQNWVLFLHEFLSSTNGEVYVLSENDAALSGALEPLASQYTRLSVLPPLGSAETLNLLHSAARFIGASNEAAAIASACNCLGALFVHGTARQSYQQVPFRSKLIPISENDKTTPARVLALIQGQSCLDVISRGRAQISAFIVCCNEGENIRRCLESVAWCDEIVVVDSGSTDGTLDICREYTDRIVNHTWEGFVGQKRFALTQCRYDWILNLDADEEVSTELRSSILEMLSLPDSKASRFKGYEVCRMVYFLNQWWERGGWYPEYRLRVLHREAADWGGSEPHEKALVSGRCSRLKGALFHYTYSGIPHQIECLNRHSTVAAKVLYRRGERTGVSGIVLHALIRFIKFYFLKLGFLEGRSGFVVAFLEAWYAFAKYAKLWELQKLESAD